MNWRMMPPPSGPMQSIVVNGRTYSGTPGSVYDVLDADARTLNANGWSFIAPSGPTSARPSGSVTPYPNGPGIQFFDTTIDKLIVSDGATWRDPASGASI